jgi:hypothetical protein
MTRCKLFFAIPLTLLSFSAFGKDKHPKNAAAVSPDQIDVVAHLPLPGGPISGFLETRHYQRNYLYVEHQSGKTVSLIDITSSAQPVLLADMGFPSGASDSLVAVAGNAALVSGQAPPSTNATAQQTFRIMSFADPQHPTVKQEFDNVTAISRDDRRGLIFLANDAGVWILQQRLAADPEQTKLQKEIERSIYDTP